MAKEAPPLTKQSLLQRPELSGPGWRRKKYLKALDARMNKHLVKISVITCKFS